MSLCLCLSVSLCLCVSVSLCLSVSLSLLAPFPPLFLALFYLPPSPLFSPLRNPETKLRSICHVAHLRFWKQKLCTWGFCLQKLCTWGPRRRPRVHLLLDWGPSTYQKAKSRSRGEPNELGGKLPEVRGVDQESRSQCLPILHRFSFTVQCGVCVAY